MSTQRVSRKGIDRDFRLLSDRHMGQLRFLVVCNHPDAWQGDEARDLSAYAYQLSGFDLTLSDHTVLGGCDRGVADVDPCGIECGALRSDGRLALQYLRFEDRQLALGGKCLRVILRKLGGQLRPIGV